MITSHASIVAERLAGALDAAAEAVARAMGACSELYDTGETRSAHEEARDAHLKAAEAHRSIAAGEQREQNFPDRMAHDSAAARHRAAAAAHQFACDLGQASADDPSEDGSGMEIGAQATVSALAMSKRANEATALCRGPGTSAG